MKKLICSLAVLAGAMAGPALANEDCQAGSAWGVKEGCGGPSFGGPAVTPLPPGAVPAAPNGDPYAYRRYGNVPYVAGVPQYPYQGRYEQYPDRGRYDQGRYERRQPNPTRGDRDGDGIANRVDRYPNDPSRW